MSRIKKILLLLLLIFVVIQFIQPGRNTADGLTDSAFTKVFVVPDNVQNIMRVACYDCHSNNTRYPWYSKIQPGAWFMASHITNGKKQLNFSEFGKLSVRKQTSKLKQIANQVKDGEMPLSSYKWIHKDARLSEQDKKTVIDWMNKTADSLLAN